MQMALIKVKKLIQKDPDVLEFLELFMSKLHELPSMVLAGERLLRVMVLVSVKSTFTKDKNGIFAHPLYIELNQQVITSFS